jgi:hypothetical protein
MAYLIEKVTVLFSRGETFMQDPLLIYLRHLILCVVIFSFGAFPSNAGAEEQAALWSELGSGNHFAMLRHAIAPGTGDPPGFDLNNCRTQRNLSEEGRIQSRLIGQRFRDQGLSEVLVFSSQWCRCLETAKLLNLGEVEELPTLNSFFADFSREEEQT